MDSIGLLELVALGINLNHYKKIGFDSNGKYIVDIFEDIDLRGKDLTNINLIKLREVAGNFNCSGCHLTSLDFAPESVKGNFNCYDNPLTSLQGCPKKVAGNFNCSCNLLTSLDYAPEYVGKNFNCYKNSISDISTIPTKYIGGKFYGLKNPITNADVLKDIAKDGFVIEEE